MDTADNHGMTRSQLLRMVAESAKREREGSGVDVASRLCMEIKPDYLRKLLTVRMSAGLQSVIRISYTLALLL